MEASSLVAAMRVRSVLLALALLLGAAPAYAEKLIWWEGESAKQTKCLSNLRQLGNAFVMYTNENQYLMPGGADGMLFRLAPYISFCASFDLKYSK